MQFDLNDCTQKALRQRPELVALADEANSYSRQADSVRDSWFPQTSVIGAYDYTQNEYNLNPAVTQVGVACQWTFFSSGKIRHEVAGLRDESQSKRHLHDYMQWTITLEVHQNLLNLDSERQQVVLNLEATKHAEEQVRMARRHIWKASTPAPRSWTRRRSASRPTPSTTRASTVQRCGT